MAPTNRNDIGELNSNFVEDQHHPMIEADSSYPRIDMTQYGFSHVGLSFLNFNSWVL